MKPRWASFEQRLRVRISYPQGQIEAFLGGDDPARSSPATTSPGWFGFDFFCYFYIGIRCNFI
jgi:hypothetical protein